MSLWHAERELKKVGRKDLAKIVAGVREAYGADVPLPQAQSQEKSKRTQSKSVEIPQPVELDLDSEWQRQSAKFVDLGYHAELGQTEEEAYLESLPKFEPQPQEYQGKFDVPLLVETRIPWQKQAELAGISLSDYLRVRIEKTTPWEGSRSEVPSAPYTGWFNNWGQRFPKNIAPSKARNQLAKDEVGAGPFEGIALQIAHPEFIKNRKYFDLIGSQVESDRVVSLDGWSGRPGLYAHRDGNATDDFRPLVRGSKIVTGN